MAAELVETVKSKGKLPLWIRDFLETGPYPEEFNLRKTSMEPLCINEEREERGNDADGDKSVSSPLFQAEPSSSSSPSSPSQEQSDNDNAKDSDVGGTDLDPSHTVKTEQMFPHERQSNQGNGDDGHCSTHNRHGHHSNVHPHPNNYDDDIVDDRSSEYVQRRKKARRDISQQKRILKESFQSIKGTRECFCLVDNCKRKLNISNKREHLRACHLALPPITCEFCPYTTFSNYRFRQHKKSGCLN